MKSLRRFCWSVMIKSLFALQGRLLEEKFACEVQWNLVSD